MATKERSPAELKLIKMKEAVEEAKIAVHNAKIDFTDAKRAFLADAKARSKKLVDSLTKQGR